jgi:glyoxylase-like metal-dependent hydrolase (beta-lactamase superfamily II)
MGVAERVAMRGWGWIAAVTLLGPRLDAQDVMHMRAERLNERVSVISGFTNGNILVIAADTAVVLVDAQSAKRVGLADSVIRSLTTLPVRFVINTHYHGDHIEGNAHFRERGAIVLAHENVTAQAKKDTTITDWRTWHRTAADPASLPTWTFRDSTVIAVGRERIVVFHLPNAHTDGDALVWLPAENIIHVGDIFENGAPPFIDWWAGGSLRGTIAAVDRVLARIDARTRVVPGHGPVADKLTLAAYRAMLATIDARVSALVAQGKSLDEIVAAGPAAEFSDALGGPSKTTDFIGLLYAGRGR